MYKNFSKVYDKFMEVCDYDEWIEILERHIKENNPEGKKILDLGCGTGKNLLKLSEKYECSGLDLSEEMLKRAKIRLKGKNVPLFLGDMRAFDTGEKYDIIFSFFDTVNHLTSTEDLMDLFNSVIWEHFYDEEENIDQIEATYFVKNKNRTFDRLTEYYEKRIFTENEIFNCSKNARLNLVKYEKNDKIAGKRFFYVLKNEN